MWPADKNRCPRYLFRRLDKASWIGCEARVSRLGLRTKATASSTVGVNKGNVDTSPVLCGMGITCKLPPWMYTWEGKKKNSNISRKERAKHEDRGKNIPKNVLIQFGKQATQRLSQLKTQKLMFLIFFKTLSWTPSHGWLGVKHQVT